MTVTESAKRTDALEFRNFTEKTFLGMTGFTFSTVTIFVSAYSPLLATSACNTPVMHGITHGLMFLSMAAFYFIVSRHIKYRDKLFRKKLVRSLFFALQLLLPCAWLLESQTGFALPIPAAITLWVANGIACAYYSCAWIDFQGFLGEERIRTVNLWAFAMAGCLSACVLAMPATTGVAAYLLLCAGSFFLLLLSPFNEQEEMSERDEYWFAENSKYSANGSYIMIVDGLILGVITGLLVARVSKGTLPSLVIGLAFLCVAAVFFLLNRKKPELLALGRCQLVFLPVLVSCLILSGFLGEPWNTVASLPLFVILYLFDYTNSSVLALRGSLLAVSPSYCFSKGRIFIIFGQAVGWFGGAFLASDVGRGSLPTVSVLMIILVCLYIAIATVKPDKYPIVNEDALDQSIPLDSVPQLPEQAFRQPFKHKCAQAIKTYGLTPREGEILFYLAKGRNAKYIADQLYVAERTVKTHTYHIYQKMGIHSQQEMIDIVESESVD